MIINLDSFLEKEKIYWDKLSARLDNLELNPEKKLSFAEISELYYLYKRAVSGLSKVRTFSIERDKIDNLNMLVGRAYSYLHGSEGKNKVISPSNWFFKEVPASFKRHLDKFALTVLITVVGMLFGAGVLIFDYDSKPYIMPFSHLSGTPTERVEMEKMDEGKHIEGNEATFASFLMTHNIKVSIFALALGLTLGVGTIILLFYNGVILGAVMADYIMDGQGLFLGGWLLPHGVIEIPAILVAGQIGFILAKNQMSTLWKKKEVENSISNRKDIVNLIFCFMIMLVWAGIVEAFLSQYHEPIISYEFKILIGCVELVLLIIFLSGKMTEILTLAKSKKI